MSEQLVLLFEKTIKSLEAYFNSSFEITWEKAYEFCFGLQGFSEIEKLQFLYEIANK